MKIKISDKNKRLKTYCITTFGCQANWADSERIATEYEARGFKKAKSINEADCVIINTCMVRQMAEDRVYGLYHNLTQQNKVTGKPKKIVVTGCMVGTALRGPDNKFMQKLRKKMPLVNEWLPIEEVGFDLAPLRTDKQHAWIPISNGCNNFCTFCVVPFSRGREISRPFEDILAECKHLAKKEYTSITLIGQNVNSYGADLISRMLKQKSSRDRNIISKKENAIHIPEVNGHKLKLTYVKHLGRNRIPTLFPELLNTICKEFPEFKKVEFLSSNPWDFSDDLIETIAKYPQISREIHLPVQSGSNRILKKMNRWYTAEEYLVLIGKIKKKIPEIQFTTDIIVGFPGEREEDFEATVKLVKKAKFIKAYVARYSPRPHTVATKAFPDDVPYTVKKKRWKILDELINVN